MADLAGRGPLGQKSPKQPKGPRGAIPARSKKRLAYLASEERQDGLAHMAMVKGLSCVACGSPPPSDAHHVTGDGKPRDDMRVIPLCKSCHQGPNGYHAAKRSWVAKHGRDCDFLDAVIIALARRT